MVNNFSILHEVDYATFVVKYMLILEITLDKCSFYTYLCSIII